MTPRRVRSPWQIRDQDYSPDMPVITISRQFGAAGVPIGLRLAHKFDAELLDRQIVAQVALRAGIPEADIESYDERLPSFWQRVTTALATSSPEPQMVEMPYVEQLPAASMQERLVAITRAVIEEASERGNAVIIGRGGAYILRTRPDVLHVQLHASLDARVRYLLSRVEDLPSNARPEEKSLRDLCRSVDATRGEYIKRVFNVDWLDVRNYDLAVDTGRMGVDKAADLIERAARDLVE
jgi:cytidylate kinase